MKEFYECITQQLLTSNRCVTRSRVYREIVCCIYPFNSYEQEVSRCPPQGSRVYVGVIVARDEQPPGVVSTAGIAVSV